MQRYPSARKTTSRNPRSTVGTITEISDYLRVLFARVGTQYCHSCGRKVQNDSSLRSLMEAHDMAQQLPDSIY